MAVISKKICLIGNFGVGKTSLIRQFVDRQFSDQYLSTVGVKISRKAVELSQQSDDQPQTVQLMIWDIEGKTKFKDIAPNYLQGASGAIVVSDASRADTIAAIQEHIALFSSINPAGWIIIAFNKSDLVEPVVLETLHQETAQKTSDRVANIYSTSAKTGQNVDEVFATLAAKLV